MSADEERPEPDQETAPPPEAEQEAAESESATATEAPPKPDSKPSKNPPKPLPPWKVLLHNDDVNSFEHVISSITMLTTLNQQDAVLRTYEAHKSGVALLLTTHKERAELYRDQFLSRSLTVTIEPAD